MTAEFVEVVIDATFTSTLRHIFIFGSYFYVTAFILVCAFYLLKHHSIYLIKVRPMFLVALFDFRR